MNRIKLVLFTLLVASSAAATAAEMGSTAEREQRMDDALQTYRSRANQEPSKGPVARSEASVKRGVGKAGAAVKRTAHKVGDAVGNAAHKTGDAIRRTGEKMGGSSEGKN